MKKIIIAITVVVCGMLFYLEAVSSGLSHNVLRLHVVANSDSYEDQDLKIKVRDAILAEAQEMSDAYSIAQSKQMAEEKIEEFEEIARQTLLENGSDQQVKITQGVFYFPTKHYGNIALPAGEYEALRIELGQAQGQNWWCVMFPPLCFIDSAKGDLSEEALEKLEQSTTEEQYKLITSDEINVTVKFKLIETIKSGMNNIKTALVKAES